MKRELRGKKSRKQRETVKNPQMGQVFFTYLPSEMIMNILSRLPIRSIIRCKFVCKSWLHLLASPEFVKSHLSKSVAGLSVFTNAYYPKPYKFFEFVDELNLNRHVLRWNMDTVFNFNLPCDEPLHSSANGLLFLYRRGVRWYHDLHRLQRDGNLFICNPITRDYIMIPCPQESSFSNAQLHLEILETYGFGVSRMSRQYKLVGMLHGWIPHASRFEQLAESECHVACQVYTVGTGSWRRIGSGGRPLLYTEKDVGVFLNGNLHWLTREMKGSSLWISYFDLEPELFSTFSPPRPDHGESRIILSALGECLCLCDNSSKYEIVIWLMKEYGDDKSWAKEFIITKRSPVVCSVRPIKVFKNGDILMVLEECTRLLYFTSKTKSVRKFDVFGLNGDFKIHAIMYAPSFVPLKFFAMENVFRLDMDDGRNTRETQLIM